VLLHTLPHLSLMIDSLIAGMVVAGRYRLERRFASGAWGSLWHAHDEKSHLNCTVRLADAGVVDLKAVRVRFAREVRAANALRCENVVNVLDDGEWSGMPFVVFESLSGEDLATRLRREGRLEAGQVIEIVSDVAHALSRAHALGIVHRDLKPENIFLIRVGANEVAKVLDFGVAGGGPGASLDRTTKVGHYLGQPLYTSPEQATAGNVDFRSDLWSLAAIAYHCLAGRPPFESAALHDLLAQIASAPVPKLTEFDPELLASLDAWCENALSRDPELRFQSAEELADALAHAFQRVTLTGHASPEWQAREARRSEKLSEPAESLAWLSAIPDASARGNDDAPLSRQRATWDFAGVPSARRRALRVSVGAVLGLFVVVLGVALVRTNSTRTTLAEMSLPRRQEPAPSTQIPAASVGAAAQPEIKPAELETPSEAASSEASPSVVPTDTAPLTPPPPDPVPCQAPTVPAEARPREVRPREVRPREATKTSRPVPASSEGTPRARSTPRTDVLLDPKGEPDYGI
jgi:serine/threonine protein kinase